ncbi:hypothetical protein PoMZ_05437 [Pyricularia oryzae]|uniref:Uncharacterized protein n=1 Tax=Pyricularia oryzae TaxID=318829 RepID=A0A4P7NNJ7_PYROR|nr:hypothetical protein PoMZ_05437 [Pyricularia oryzae]
MSCRQTTLRIDRPDEPCCNGWDKSSRPSWATCAGATNCHSPSGISEETNSGPDGFGWLLIGSHTWDEALRPADKSSAVKPWLVQTRWDDVSAQPIETWRLPGPPSVRQVSKRAVTNVPTVPGHGLVAVADHNRTLGVFCGTRTAVQLDAKLPRPTLGPCCKGVGESDCLPMKQKS